MTKLMGMSDRAARGDSIEAALRWREKQYATLAEIGLLALRQSDIDLVLDTTARRLREALDADFTKVLDQRAGSAGLLLRAGAGWPEGVVGAAEVPEGAGSQAGYTLAVDEPVIVDDLPSETRFEPPALLLEHGVRSGISVVIEGDGRPLGVLEADSRTPRHFGPADIPVLQAYANVLGGAIAQHEREHLSAEFAALAAHELRTPLTVLIGYGSRLLRLVDEEGRLERDRRDELAAMYEEAIRLRRSVELFLALGDAQRRAGALETREEDLVDLVEAVVAIVTEGHPDRRIMLEAPAPSLPFVTDALAFSRIVTNLVENGAKYSPPGSQVTLTLELVDGEAVVSVRDSCGGIASDDLRRLFLWRHRGQEAEAGEGGFGLGLFIAQRMADQLGGRLDARNDGGGCIVSLHVPAGGPAGDG